MSSTRVVVCAANKYGPFMYTGIRHFCPVMQKNMEWANVPLLRTLHGEVQGFVDQYGVFMDRYEALEVATAAGQINRWRLKSPGDKLFSEDIY